MILLDAQIPSFDRYLEECGRFWGGIDQRRTRNDGYVVVDLLHNNGPILLGSLFVGRLVAHRTGARLAAIVSDKFLEWPTPVKEVRRLAAAFGVERFHHIEAEAAPVPGPSLGRRVRGWLGGERERLLERLERLSGAALREAVLGIAIDGVPVGDLLYDTYLRNAAIASVEAPAPGLLREIFAAFPRIRRYREIMGRPENVSSVVSHPTYIDSGGLLRATVALGKPCYCKIAPERYQIRKYRTIPEAYEYPWPTEEDLRFVQGHLGAELSRRADVFFPPQRQRAEEISYFALSYGADALRPAAAELRERLGIAAEVPVVSITAPMFDDAPHSIPDTLFPDPGVWLRETLAVAATVDRVVWLVRNHPYAVALGQTANFDAIVGPYAERHGHIKVCPPGIATEAMFPLVQANVSVASTACLEMASVGIPSVVAGRPNYADMGFMTRPRTVSDYGDALRRIDRLPRLSAEQIMTAKELAYVFFNCSTHTPRFAPPLVAAASPGVRPIGPEDISGYWDAATELLRDYDLDGDPVRHDFERMEALGRSFMLRFHEIEPAAAGRRVP